MTLFKIHKKLILIFLIELTALLGCRKKSADEGRAKQELSEDVTQTSFSGPPGLNIYSMPTQGDFILPEDTVSFAVIAFSKSSGGSIVFHMRDPNQRNVFADLVKGGYIYAAQGATVLLNPLVPNMPITKGVWNYSFQNTTTVKMALRTGEVNSTLPVRPIFTGTVSDKSDIEGAMTALTNLLKTYGLQVKSLPILHIKDPQFAAVQPDFQSEKVRRLAEFGDFKNINLFFIEEILDSSTLGIASRIPATFGVHPFNMVMVGLEQHRQSSELDTDYIMQTMLHEIGHLVGLFHTTEKTGRKFDPLDDTPKCEKSVIEASSWTCGESEGRKNIMFWQSSSEQTQLSPSQVHIFKYSPIAQ